MPEVEYREELDSIGKMKEELEKLVAAVVPVQHRVFIADIIICEEGVDCTAVTSDEESAHSVVEVYADKDVL